MRYFDEINIMRAFAIMAVISIHVSGNYTFMSPDNFLAIVYMAIGVFSGFAVPLFIGISGFVLYNKYPEKIDLKKFYQKRLMSVLPPYIIFSTIYLGFECMRTNYIPMQTIAYKYLTGGWNYSYWFFIIIIQFYLLYPVIIRIYHYGNSRGRSFELLMGTYFLGVVYFSCIEPGLSIAGETAAPLLGSATQFTGYLFYFILGITVRGRYEDLLRKPVSDTLLYTLSVPLLCGTIIGIVSCLRTNYKFNIIQILPASGKYWNLLAAMISPIYVVIIFTLCLTTSLYIVSHKPAAFKVLEKIGHYSFGIYLVHLIFLTEIVRWISRFGFGWNNLLFFPITFSLTLIFSTVFVELIQKLPYSRYIIGNTRQER
jgi:peptidoglycan/LPS O-acetylase OafA/YrhL